MECDVVLRLAIATGGAGRYERLVPPLRRRERHGRQSRHHGLGSHSGKHKKIINYPSFHVCYYVGFIN